MCKGTITSPTCMHRPHNLDIYMSGSPINAYNDNNACVCWSKSTTTKGLRHITFAKIKILHIAGKSNLADMFTKEMKNV